MTSDSWLKLFAILNPFLASYLTYLFTTQGKRKDVDIQKEKELNVVLADLMLVWHYLKSFERVAKLLSDNQTDLFVPKKYIPRVALETNLINDKCFTTIDASIEMLKKYDPILYYELQGMGDRLDKIKEKYILPFFQNPDTDPKIIASGAGTLLVHVTKDIQEYIDNVAKKLGKHTVKEVNSFVRDKSNINSEKMSEEMNMNYYNLFLQVYPEGQQKPTFDQFKEFTKTDEFTKVIEFQMDVVLNHDMNDLINIISGKPDITFDEIKELLNKNKK